MTLVVSLIVVAIVVIAVWLPTLWMRRRGMKSRGTSDVVVRCSRGHLFTTIWVPGVSFKSVRLGTVRVQHCPVGRHWSKVRPVPIDQLSDAERIEAARVHDIRLP
ncbi:MAG: hypothetical protein HIU57_03690 [Acidobacteria bacterium]|nr:hypothetical protein [Acidobacteriota bacterium]